MGIGDTLSKIGRVGAGVQTLGSSEIGPIGAVTGSLKDAYGGEAPVRKQTDLDPTSQALLNHQAEDASKSDQQVADELTQGVNEHGGIIHQPIHQNSGLLRGPDDLDQALAARSQRGFDTATRDINQGAQTTARKMQSQRLQTAAGNLAARDAIKRNAYNTSLNDQLMKQQQKLQFIESVVGTGAKIGTMAATGGASAAVPQGQQSQAPQFANSLSDGYSSQASTMRGRGAVGNA